MFSATWIPGTGFIKGLFAKDKLQTNSTADRPFFKEIINMAISHGTLQISAINFSILKTDSVYLT